MYNYFLGEVSPLSGIIIYSFKRMIWLIYIFISSYMVFSGFLLHSRIVLLSSILFLYSITPSIAVAFEESVTQNGSYIDLQDTSSGGIIPIVGSNNSTGLINTPSTEEEARLTNTGDIEDEEDESNLDLWNDQLDLDATKDFTAIVRQSKEYTCGPASLATLMTQLGNNTSEEEILPQLQDLNPEKWVSLYDLKQAAEKLEQHVYLKKWSTETILAYIERTSDPVLIHDEKKWVGWHFSVIKSYNSEKWQIELSDTEAGNIKYNIEDFNHIYTGDALIISDDTGDIDLNNVDTNISDADALRIWGKYVPVVLYAQKNGYKSAVDSFRICQNSALALTTAAKRNTARRMCYEDLSSTMGSAMSNSTELWFMTSYNISDNRWNTENLWGEFWLNAITKILTDKLQANKTMIATKQTGYNTKTSQYNTAIGDTLIIKAKVAIYNTAVATKTLLESTLATKKSTQTALSSEINGGVFTQGNQTFSLGAVGNQLTAQSSNYAKLSASLSSRLSNIDGQIRQIQTQQRNAQANYDAYNSQYNTHIASYQSYLATASRYYLLYQTSRINRQGNLNNYNNYSNLANLAQNNASIALSNRNYWKNTLSNIAWQITTLQSQKSSAQGEVNNAAAEKARLETLKKFGDTELQRKKTLLASITTEIVNLSKQISAIVNISSLFAEIATLRASLVTANTWLKKEIDTLKSEIDTISAEITAQQAEIANESTNEKSWDDSAEIGATQDMRYAPAVAINNAIGVVKSTATIIADAGKYAWQVANGIIVTTYDDTKVCINKWWIQECLSTCWVSMDAATAVIGSTVVWLPVAGGTTIVWATCDFTNGLIYFWNGNKVQGGVSALAIFPFAGSLAKWSTKEVLRLTKEGEEAVKVIKSEGRISAVLAKGIKSIDLDHIKSRHAYGSAPLDASKYLQWTNIEAVINEWYWKPNKKFMETMSWTRPSIEIEVDIGKKIGTNSNGNGDYNILRMVMDYDGNIISAYPVANFKSYNQ